MEVKLKQGSTQYKALLYKDDVAFRSIEESCVASGTVREIFGFLFRAYSCFSHLEEVPFTLGLIKKVSYEVVWYPVDRLENPKEIRDKLVKRFERGA